MIITSAGAASLPYSCTPVRDLSAMEATVPFFVGESMTTAFAFGPLPSILMNNVTKLRVLLSPMKLSQIG